MAGHSLQDRKPDCPVCGSNQYGRLSSIEWKYGQDTFQIHRCRFCGLVRTLPLPNPEVLQKLYGESYFRRLMTDSETHRKEYSRFRSLFRLVADGIPRGPLLSVGCGLGFDLRIAEEFGFFATGVESSPVAVDFASKVLKVNVKLGSIDSIGQGPARFNLVTFWDVLEHLPRPDEALRTAASILARDGVIVVRAPNADGLFPRVSFLLSPILGEWRHPEPPAHLFDFSPRTLATLAARCELRVRSILMDEWPLPQLIEGSRRPVATSALSAILYPAARMLKMGNSMIATLERLQDV